MSAIEIDLLHPCNHRCSRRAGIVPSAAPEQRRDKKSKAEDASKDLALVAESGCASCAACKEEEKKLEPIHQPLGLATTVSHDLLSALCDN